MSIVIPRSRSISGQLFSVDHDMLLRTIARARQWQGCVWVPAKVAAQLRLPLALHTCAPVELTNANGTSWVYHASQFTVPLPTLQAAWRDFEKAETQKSTLADRYAQPFSEKTPLNTNGERFDQETEARILEHCEGRPEMESRYWTTAAEALHVFGAPFRDAYVAEAGNGVLSYSCSLCRPLTLFNVEGTQAPTRFSAATCRRYDPVNYEGHFYRPAAATAMKAMAIRHTCLHEPQWITTSRARRLGLDVPRSVVPLAFFITRPIRLVNIAMTTRSARIRGRVITTSASPTEDRDTMASEDAMEAALLASSVLAADTAEIEQDDFSAP